MNPAEATLEKVENKSNQFLGIMVLSVLLAILAIRAACTEAFHPSSGLSFMGAFDTVKSLSLSAILILASSAAIIYSAVKPKFKYFSTGIEAGLIVFAIGATIATYAASNVRDSITYSITLIAPIITAIILVYLLDRRWKIYLVFMVLTGLGVLNTFSCADQLFVSNKEMITQYEESPDEQLKYLSIEKGTLEHFMYEHRLYSKDIKGYFTTGNSAGSFFLLSAASAIMLMINAYKSRKQNPLGLACTIIALIIILLGLFMTGSKGAISGMIIAVGVYAFFAVFKKILCRFKKTALVLVILLVVVSAWFIIAYGIKHDRLPGGNSMLVRWQYWKSSAQIVMDNPLGVGGANFAKYYTMYKNPSAIETVNDPHNFVLSILCQYGFAGLIGIIMAMFWPMLKIIFAKPTIPQDLTEDKNGSGKIGVFVVMAVMLLMGLIACKGIQFSTRSDVNFYLVLVFYVVPASIFFISCFLLWPRGMTADFRPVYSPILICAIIGFMIHNLIDFAIFEPGVWMAFWVIIASMVANNKLENGFSGKSFVLPKSARYAVCALVVVFAGGFIKYGYAAPAKTAVLVDDATQKFEAIFRPEIDLWASQKKLHFQNTMQLVNSILEKASAADRFDPMPGSAKGRLFKYAASLSENDEAMLIISEAGFAEAIARDKADFKNYENLSLVCAELAKVSKNKSWLDKAIENALKAVSLYPGNDKLHFAIAEIAESLGEKSIALEHYKKAVELEDGFREQFKVMYPGREIVSRLGNEKYKAALNKIEEME